MQLTGYLQRSYDGNFLLVYHRGSSGRSGEEVRNGRERVEWSMGLKRKAVGNGVYHQQNLDDESGQTIEQREVMKAAHSMDRRI